MFKIESGIPIPNQETKRMSEVSLIVMKMKRGQSFVVNSEGHRSTAYTAAKRSHRRLTTRKIDGRGIRIWRVK